MIWWSNLHSNQSSQLNHHECVTQLCQSSQAFNIDWIKLCLKHNLWKIETLCTRREVLVLVWKSSVGELNDFHHAHHARWTEWLHTFHRLKGHCIEFKYYADGILVLPRRLQYIYSWPAGITKAEVSPSLFTPLSHHYRRVYSHHTKFYTVPL